MSNLPPLLRQALDGLLTGQSRRDLARRSNTITATYRGRKNSSVALLSDADATAYAVARMPATYAAMACALGGLTEALPDLRPTTMLDVGCGPGTAAYAAATIFASLTDISLLDRNEPFLRLATKLAATFLANQHYTIGPHDLVETRALPVADLVTAGYVLAELTIPQQSGLIDRLWRATGIALVLTEPGTPDGFARLATVRRYLLDAGAHIAAPCTHDAPCPMSGSAWCRFPVRIQRSRDHIAVKSAAVPYEDEPVAYLVATRLAPQRVSTQRIVGPPVATKAEIALPACGPDGLTNLSAPRRDPEKFKSFKKLDWGDSV